MKNYIISFLLRVLWTVFLGVIFLNPAFIWAQAPYCGASVSFGCATDRICNVSFSGCQNLNNPQPLGQECDVTTFQSYTHLSPPRVCAGAQLQAQIQTVCCNGPGCPPEFAQFIGVWLDFNQDSDFNDPGEFIAATPIPQATWNLTIPIPAGAACGDTRLRIRTRWFGPAFSAAQACGALLDWGETEDYTVTIVNLPAPNSATFSFCQADPQNIILTPNHCATPGTATFRWYDSPLGGNLIAVGNQYISNFGVGSHTLWVSHYDATCNCESPRSPIFVNVLAAPPALTLASNAPICSSLPLQLTANGAIGVVSWSGPLAWNATGANVTRAPAEAGIYTAFQTGLNGCASPPAAINVEVIQAPAQPLALPKNRCGQGSVTFPVAMGAPAGHGVLLYTVATGGSPVAADFITPFFLQTPLLTTNTTFYIAAQDTLNQCQSVRLAVEANVFPEPSIPAVNPVSRCGSGSVILTVTGVAPGEQARLYTQANSVTPVATATNPPYELLTPALAQSATFYVEVAGAGGCVSPKVAVPVTIHPNPGVPFSQDVSRCGAGSLTFTVLLDNLFPADQALLYTLPTGGVPIAAAGAAPYLLSSPFLTQSQIFYIAATNTQTGCESSRLPVNAQILPLPGAPNIANLERCGGGSLIFTVSFQPHAGNLIQMYTQPSGGAPLQTAASGAGYTAIEFLITVSTNATFYFEAQTSGGCASPRTPAVATIHPLPEAPETPKVTRCGPGPVTFTPIPAPLNGGDSFWLYSTPIGGSPISSSSVAPYELSLPLAVSTQTFWVASQNTATGCQSLRAPTIVEVSPLPGAPVAPPSFSRCGPGPLSFSVSMGVPSGGQIQIWDSPLGGNLIAQSAGFPYAFTLNIANTVTYFVESVAQPSGCQSSRVPLELIIHPLPSAPNFLPASRCEPGVVTLTALPQNPAQEKVALYDVPNGGHPIAEANASPFTLATPFLAASSNFFLAAINTQTGCASSRAAVNVDILPAPSQPEVANAVSCDGEPALLSITMGPNPGNYVALYTVAVGGAPIAIQNAAPYQLQTPAITTHTTFYISAGYQGSSCESPRKITPVHWAPKPSAPQVTPANRCGAGEVVFTATMGAVPGNVIRVYNQASGGNLIASASASPYLLSVPGVAATAPFWFSAQNTITGCESPRVSSLAIINLPPAAPIGSDIARCGPGPIQIEAQMGVPAGNEMRLFTVASGGEPIAQDNFAPFSFSMFLPANQVFYLESRNSITGCVSPRASVVVTLHPLPASPIVPEVAICGGGSVTFSPILLAPQADQARLYASPSDASLLASDNSAPYFLTTPPLSATATFYVSAFNSQTGCESPKSAAIARLASLPGPPIAQDFARCGAGKIAIAALTGSPSGDQLALYDSPVGGTLIATALSGQWVELPNVSASVTYYWESQNTQAQCFSPRTPTAITVHPLPTPPAVANVNRCGPGAVTFTPIFLAGPSSQILVYTQPLGGSPIATALQAPYQISLQALENQTYYFEHYNWETGCASARVPAEIMVTPVAAAPIAAKVSSCVPAALTFTAISNQNWTDLQARLYDQPQGGNIIALSQTPPYLLTTPYLAASQTYYVAFANALGQCEGQRTPVIAEILPTTPAPVIENEKRCGPGPITFFPSSAQSAVRLYNAEAGGALLAEDLNLPFELTVEQLEPAAVPYTYYISAFNAQTGCESPRVAVRATVYELPAPPILENVIRCGAGEVIFTAQLADNIQKTVRVYDRLNSQNPIAELSSAPFSWKAPAVSTSTEFYFTTYDLISGCQSPATAAKAIIEPTPAPVNVADVSRCGPGPVTFSVSMNQPAGNEIRMYTAAAGDAPIQTDASFPYLFTVNDLANNESFYFSAYNSATGCEGERVKANVFLAPRPVNPVISAKPICGQGSVTIEVIAPSASSVALFSEAVGGNPIAIDYNEPFVLLAPYQTTTATYYVSVLGDNGCQGERQAVEALIFPTPPTPSSEPVSRCGAGPIAFTVNGAPLGYEAALFATPLGGAPIAVTQAFPYELYLPEATASATYYIGLTDLQTGCSGPRQAARVEIKPLPGPPSALNLSLCGEGTLSFTAELGTPAGDALFLFATPSGGAVLSSDDNPPYILQTPYLTQSATLYLEARDSQSGCRSQRSAVNIEVLPLPGSPLALSQSGCIGQSLTFSVNFTSPAGNQILMYAHSSAGLPIQSKSAAPFTFTTPELETTTSYYFSARNTVTGCESPRVEAKATIFTPPAAPIVAPVAHCGAASVALTAQSVFPGNFTARLYNELEGSAPIAEKEDAPYELYTPAINRTTTFYLSFRDNLSGCESSRAPVIATIAPLPQAPILQDAFRCGPGVITLSLAENIAAGNIVRLFDQEVGGARVAQAVAEPYILEVNLTQSAAFYAEALDPITGCSSARSPVIAEVRNLPGAPISQNLKVCRGANVAIPALMGAPAGQSLRLYIAPNSAMPLDEASQAPYQLKAGRIEQNTTFYLSSVSIEGCESPRVPVEVSIEAIPASPIVAQPIERCGAGPVVITANMGIPAGDKIAIYTQSQGGQEVASALAPPYRLFLPSVSQTQTYFIESITTAVGCPSARVPVVVQILQTPGIPFAASVQRCGPGRIEITASMGAPSGNALRLFDSPIGGNLIAQAQGSSAILALEEISQSITYYLESYQSANRCASSRVPVSITIVPLPEPPAVADVNICGRGIAVFSPLVPLGNWQLRLYESPAGGRMLSQSATPPYEISSPLLSQTQVFGLSLRDNSTGCESQKVPVKAEVAPAPSAPLSLRASRCQGGPVTFSLAQLLESNEKLELYTLASGGQALAQTQAPSQELITPAITQTTTFYIQKVIEPSGCASERTPVVAHIFPAPPAPSAANVSRCGQGQAILTVTGIGQQGETVRLFSEPIGGILLAEATSAPYLLRTPALNVSSVFFLETRNVWGCSSPRIPVEVNINPVPSAPTLSSNTPLCEGQTLSLEATGAPGSIFIWQGPNGFSATSATIQLPEVDLSWQGSYSAVALLGGCTSAVGNVQVQILPGLPKPEAVAYSDFGGSRPFCQGEELNLAVANFADFPHGVSFIWSGPAGFTSSLPSPAIMSLGQIHQGVYSVYAAANGCASPISSVEVIVNPRPPAPLALSDAPVCLGQSFTLTATSTPGAEKYQWYGPSGFSFTGQSFTRQAEPNSAGVYSLAAISAAGCASTLVTHNVQFFTQPPQPEVTHNAPLCQGSALALSVQGNGEYYLEAPAFAQAFQGSSFGRANMQLQDAGVYTMVAIANGCTSLPTLFEVRVKPLPAPPIVKAEQPICEGKTLRLLVEDILSASDYIWSGPNNFFARAAQVSIPNLGALHNGQYVARAVLEGCVSEPATVNVAVNPRPAAPVIESSGAICLGGIFFMTITNADPNLEYRWWGPAQFSASGSQVFRTNSLATYSGLYQAVAIQNGCSSEIGAVSIEVRPLPSPPAVYNNGPLCAGEDATLWADIAPEAEYFWMGPNGFMSVGRSVSIPALTPEKAGIYSLMFIQHGCAAPIVTTNLVLKPTPAPPIASSDSPKCAGQTLNLSVSGQQATYIWRGPAGFSQTTENTTVRILNATPAMSGTYTVTAVANGCSSAPAFVSVSISSTPSVPFIRHNAPVCEGAALQLSVETEPGVVYEWSGPQSFSAVGAAATRNPVFAQHRGTYRVTANRNGCRSAAASANIVVNATPPPPIVNVNTSICTGQLLELSAITPSGAVARWEGPNGFTAEGNIASRWVASVAEAGNYSAYVVVGNCTSARASIAVTAIEADRAPQIEASSPICQGQTLRLTTPAAPGAIYHWSGPQGFSSSLQNPQIANITTAQAGVYQLYLQVGNCFTPSALVNVTVRPTPAPPIAMANGPLCEGQTLSLTATESPGAAYIWSGPAGFFSSSQYPVLPNVTTANAGVYNVHAQIGGCASASSAVAVQIFRTPAAPTLASSSPLCEGQTLYLTAGVQPNVFYHWRGPNGFFSSSPSPFIENITTAAAGVYSLQVSLGSCTSAASSTVVQVTPTPKTPEIGSNSPICEGSSLRLFTKPESRVNYLWQGPAGFHTQEVTPLIEAASVAYSGVYSLVASIGNCSSEVATTGVVVLPKPQGISVSHNAPLCAGGLLTLSAPELPNAIYSWSGPSGFQSGLRVVQIPNAQTLNSGVYSISVQIGACRSQAVAHIEILPGVNPLVAAANAPICEGQSLQLQATYIEGAQYVWSGPAGFQSFRHNPIIPNATSAQSGWYSVLAYIGECSSSSQVRVNVLPSPAPLTLSGGGSYCQGQTVNLNALSSQGVAYEWRGPNNFVSQRQSVVLENISPEAAGVYSVIAKLGNCALAPATLALQVLPLPEAPSIGQSGSACQGGRLELWASATPGSALVWQGPNGFSSTAERPVIEPLNLEHSGVYSAQAILSGCTSALAVTRVNVEPLPPSPSLRSNAPLCQGQELRLRAEAAQGATVIWESPSGERFIANNLEKRAELTHNGSWRAWQILNGCTSSVATLEINVEPGLGALSIASNAPICEGATLSLSADFIPGAAYEWSGPNGFYSEATAPIIPNAGRASEGLYSVRAKLGNCYSPLAEIFVPIRPQPAPPTVLSNAPVCQGQSLQLQAVVAEAEAQNPLPVFYWTGPNGFAAMEQNPQIHNVAQEAAGVYSVVAILGNCTSAASGIAVQVLPTPANLTAASNSALCEGQTLALSASAVPGATYIWQGPGGFTAMEQNPILWNVTTAQGGIYSVTAHIGKCRSQVATVAVTIWPAPSAIRATNNGPLCAGQALQLSASLIPGAVYEWRGPLGFFSNEINPVLPSVTPQMSGVYSVSARIGSCQAPLATTQAVIEAAPSLSAAFANSPLCAGQTLTLSVEPQLGATYTWIGPAGFSANGAEVRLSNIQTLQAGVYSVTARLGACQAGPLSVRVEVESGAPNFTLPEQRPVCQGDTIQIAAPDFANARYLWNGPSGILPEGNPLTLANVGLDANGLYTLRIIQGACTSQAVRMNVTVLPAPQTPSLAHNGPVCKGARLTLSTLAQEGFSYLWKGPGGARQFGSRWEIEPVASQDAGVYSLQAIDANGCASAAATVNVTVKGAEASFMVGDEAICQEQTAWLEIAFEGQAPFNLTYQENGVLRGITSMAPFWALPITPSQTTVYRLHSVTDASGCVIPLAATKTITVHQTPTVRLYDPGLACFGETGYIPVEVSGIGDTATWSIVYQEGGALKTFSGVGSGFFEFPTSPVTAPMAIELISITNTEGDCPRVFNGVQTTIYPREKPSATLFSTSKKQCSGQTVTMPLNVTGQGPWVIGALINGEQRYLHAGRMGQNGPILLELPFSFERSTTVILNSLEDGNGCSSSINEVWEVEVLALPKASFVGQAASICAGDSLQLSLKLEGKGPFTIAYTLNGIALAPWQIGSAQSQNSFIWDTVITPGASRLYRLTQITDSEGCSAALNSVFEVKVLANPQVNITSLTPAACSGGSVTLRAFAEGATSLVYRLGGQENADGIFTQLPAGDYTLSVANGACRQEQSVTIPALTVSGLTLNGISGGAATLSWNAAAGVDGYNVLYRVKGQSGDWQSVPVAPSSSSARITGLAAGVTYEFAVQPVCANGAVLPVSAVIEGAAPENEPCPGPQNLAIHNVTANSAVVSWMGNSFGDVCYILAYGPSAENPLLWNEILVPGGVTQTFLSGLLPGVNYGVRVKTNCTMCSRFGGLQSTWAGAFTFTTLPLKESIESNVTAAKALVYPNPTSGNIHIEYAAPAEGALKVKLTDLAGRTVFLQETAVTAGSNLLPFSFELPSGIYLLTLTQGESKLHFRLQIH